MSRRLRKLGYDGEKVRIRWDQPRGHERDEHELISKDKPAAELLDALRALRPHVAEICQLETAYCETLEIRSVSCSYGGDEEQLGVTITALKRLETARAPLVLNTPHLPTEPYSKTDTTAPVLSVAAIAAVEACERAAWRYLEGHREQRDLFERSAEAQAEEANAGGAVSHGVNTPFLGFALAMVKERLRKSRGKRGR